MHTRFSFHHFKFTPSIHHTSMDISNLILVPCKQTYEMHIQMHQTSSWACSPYLCAQNFNWSLSFFTFLPLSYIKYIFMFLSLYDISPPFSLFLLLSLFLSPFVINDHKGSKSRLSMSINGVRIIFPNLVQSRLFAKDI